MQKSEDWVRYVLTLPMAERTLRIQPPCKVRMDILVKIEI